MTSSVAGNSPRPIQCSTETLLSAWRKAAGPVDGFDVAELVIEPILLLSGAIVQPGRSAMGWWPRLVRFWREMTVLGLWGACDRVLEGFDHDRHWTSLVPWPFTGGGRSVLATSSYANAARAMLYYKDYLPASTPLAWTRWGAAKAWAESGGTARHCLWNRLRISDRDKNRRSAEKIGESYSAGVEAMRRNFSPAHAAALDSLAELFRGSVAPEVAAFRTAFLRECGDSEPQVTIVGNEFAFTDRAALILSRDHGIRTVAFAHGVFDWHYQHVGVLADHFVTWGSESARYVLESGLTPGAKVLAVRPERPGLEARSAERDTVTIFTQPVQFSRAPADGYQEGILDLCTLLATRDLRVVIKPHPMERREDWRCIPGVSVLKPTDSAADALRVSFAAVLLDSSVVVDCLRARVPAIGMGWCASTYGERMHRAGWLVNAPSPKDAFKYIAGLRDGAPGSVGSADPFEGHIESDGERLCEFLQVDPPKLRSARGRRHPEGVTDARTRSEAG